MKTLASLLILSIFLLNSCKEDSSKEIYFQIETNFGTMKGKLYNQTPKHRDNFIKLISQKYYDDLLFHRVIKNFMIQGGDPDSRISEPDDYLGMGGPGYKIDAEIDSQFIHKKGALAAAREGGPSNAMKKSSGSQFYIVSGKKWSEYELEMIENKMDKKWSKAQKEIYKSIGGYAPLDMEYTVFGEITEGLDVLDKISSQPTGRADRPIDDIEMKIRLLKPSVK